MDGGGEGFLKNGYNPAKIEALLLRTCDSFPVQGGGQGAGELRRQGRGREDPPDTARHLSLLHADGLPARLVSAAPATVPDAPPVSGFLRQPTTRPGLPATMA